MKIASTNHFADAFSSFSVTADAASGQNVEDLTTPDFSVGYTSNGSAATFVISKTFVTGFACSYVALAGHNIGTLSGTFQVSVNGVSKGSIDRGAGAANTPLMIFFDEVVATTIAITVTKLVTPTDKYTFKYIAAGSLLNEAFSFPAQNQPEAGYPKNWRTRSSKIRSVVNSSAAPVAYLRESQSRKATLTMSNLSIDTIGSQDWVDFLSLCYDEGAFFIVEEDGVDYSNIDFGSASLCYEVDVMAPKMHNSTRKLVQFSASFKTYTGF